MQKYEVMYIIKPIEDMADKVISKFNALIKANNGLVLKSEKWGEKRLAYEVNGYEYGIYVLVTFKCNFEALKTFDRVMDLSEDVLRHMIVKCC